MGREMSANKTPLGGGSGMSDEELAAEIRRRMDMAQQAPRIVRAPVTPTEPVTTTEPELPPEFIAAPPPSTQDFGLLDGMRMPADELAAEIKRRLERARDAHAGTVEETGDRLSEQAPAMSAGPVLGDAPPADAARSRHVARIRPRAAEPGPESAPELVAGSAAESAYVPVTLPADQVIPYGAYDRYEQKIRATPVPPRRRKGLYFVAAVAVLAAIAAPGSWNAISRHQEETPPVATNQPTAAPQTAPAMPSELTPEEAAAQKAVTEKAATEKAATEKAAIEKAAAEKAVAEKAAAEKAAAEKAATEKAAAEKAEAEKAAAEKARLDAVAAIEAAKPKVLTPSVGVMTPKPLAPSTPSPATGTGAPGGNLPNYTPSSSDGWLKPKPFDPSAP